MPEPTRWQPPSPRTGDWGGPDDPARRLWGLWRQGQEPRLEDFLAQAELRDPDHIVAVLRVDQSERFRIGQWVRVETYFEAFPAVRDDPEGAVDLIFAEYLLREQKGEPPAPEEYLERFPNHAEELKLQIELHRAMETHSELAPGPAGRTATFFDPRALQSGGGPDGLPEIPGYEVLGVLGRGGMGVVYRAWQKELSRLVALKMVHAGGQASPALRARFRVEAEAVARLQHPNIVQIHGVSRHGGALVLVLELVEGRSLAQQIAGTPQPAQWAAELVETVARAIHAAHQQGVVHRDLTPANVLLTVDDRPKITDFGLAKLIIGGGDLRSQTGELLGTPSYMAPEQAASRHEAIGVATDVYALGAILYELFSGRPPFKAESPLETLRQVLSDDPVAPSRLRPKLPRDLETICLKCLRKEPVQRYSSALSLAEDLRRFLDGRPTLARRSGLWERARRFCRRNRAVVLLLAMVLALCTALAIGSTVAALWLKGSRDEALQERNRAQANFREARRAVDDSFTRVSESTLLHAPGLQPLRKQLLEDALRYYHGFVQRLGNQAGVQAELAAALARVAKITSEIGSKEEAMGYLRQARAIYEALAAAHPADARLKRELARSIAAVALLRGETGRRQEAVADYQRALVIQHALVAADPGNIPAQNDLAASESGLGQVLEPLARTQEALQCYERALAIRERLTAAYPDAADFQSDLAGDHARVGRLHRGAGRPDEAIRSCRRAIAIQEVLVATHPEVAPYRSSLASTVSAYRQAIEEKRHALTAGPKTKVRLHSLGNHYLDLADAERALGQPAEAAATLWEHRQLWDDDPAGLYRLACGLALGIPLVARGQPGPAHEARAERENYADRAMDALRQAVAAGFRDVARIRRDADLGPLRGRDDFQALVAGLAFPRDPFAQPIGVD